MRAMDVQAGLQVRRPVRRGWWLVPASAFSLAVVLRWVLVLEGFDEAGVRACIRLTARTSLLVLVILFPLTALRRRWPIRATRWLRRNRRYLGLSLAVSHGYHGLFILVLYGMGRAGDVPAATLYGGGFGFAMLAAMAATSNDASQRWLGASWRRLHRAGLYTLWVIFAVSYVPRVLEAFPDVGRAAIPSLATGLLLAALVLRLWPLRTPGAASG
jgi:DMSO/TMAO reductase YedYZ heme-binding membrane subunit